MANKSSASKGGIGAVGVVQIVFIILKFTKTGVIGTWPLWKVFLPIMCSVGLLCFLGITIGSCAMCCICLDKSESTQKQNNTTVVVNIPESDKQRTIHSTSTDKASHDVSNNDDDIVSVSYTHLRAHET